MLRVAAFRFLLVPAKRYDEKTDVYSLGMLLFEMCHPPFGTKMERTVVLTAAHRLQFPPGDVWGPPKGQEAMKNMCRSMLQEQSGKRPSAADIVRQVKTSGYRNIFVFCFPSLVFLCIHRQQFFDVQLLYVWLESVDS